MWNKIKKWNWTIYFVMVCLGVAGAMANKTIPSITEALIFGLIVGNIFGLLFAYGTRED